jgi:hypothetical protein
LEELIVSGPGFSKETTMVSIELVSAFPNARLAWTREWTPIQAKSITSLAPPKIVTLPFFYRNYFDPKTEEKKPAEAPEM